MGRVLSFLIGVVCYVVFLVSFLYAIVFVGNLDIVIGGYDLAPKSIDEGIVPTSLAMALIINALLLSLFAVQHSVMARPWFKKGWTKIIPVHLERSFYVLLSSLILLAMYWQWRPLPEMVWSIENTAVVYVLQILFWMGWALVLLTTFMINHFDLFGLRQVTLYLQKKPYTDIVFQESFLYKNVRHPLMLGFIIAFWATPQMSVGHLLFTVATTGYILVGIMFEEKDLMAAHGDKYGKYREKVSMIIPMPRKK